MTDFNDYLEMIKSVSKNYSYGWRLLTTSKNTLEKNSGIFLITLNPGGDGRNIQGQSIESCENGNAYIYERWKGKEEQSKLQLQFQSIFKVICEKTNANDFEGLLESSICGYYVPFRSPTWEKLEYKSQSIEIANRIWKSIISQSTPKIIITIDKITYENIQKIITNLDYNYIDETDFTTGWGNYKAKISRFDKQSEKLSILRLPHLSRFSIFNREKSEKEIDKMFDFLLKNYEK
jgi:hypothetical protein